MSIYDWHRLKHEFDMRQQQQHVQALRELLFSQYGVINPSAFFKQSDIPNPSNNISLRDQLQKEVDNWLKDINLKEDK